MSLQVIELDDFYINNAAYSMELMVTSKAFFKFSPDSSFTSLDCLREAFASGRIWVTRESPCRLDIQIFIDNYKLGSNSGLPIIDSLGVSLCNAEIWRKLSLETTLSIPKEDRFVMNHPIISIFISPKPMNTNDHEGFFISPPPEKTFVASFERLEMELWLKTKTYHIDEPKLVNAQICTNDSIILEEASNALCEFLQTRNPQFTTSELDSYSLCKLTPCENASSSGCKQPIYGATACSKEFSIIPNILTPKSNSFRHIGVNKNRQFPGDILKASLKQCSNLSKSSLYPSKSEKDRLIKITGLKKCKNYKHLHFTRIKLTG
ncbi:unnamed protein product [Blumeria hordei]|uniref:Uncharacterized protein n=1 Tax=Blumeria hordei TaxID=2867405 RepID=A0A383UL10_BLUHO|nr:unnamed protein product [Blumeria hordei]